MGSAKAFKRFGSLAWVAVYVVLWEGACDFLGVSKDVLPAPSRILKESVGAFPYYVWHMWLTSKVIAGGLVAALLLAPPLAYAAHKWSLFDRMSSPLVVFSQVIPKPALVPLFIVWFGFSSIPNYLITFLISFYPIFANTRLGLKQMNPSYMKMMAVWKATRSQILTTIEWPSVRPFILAGLKAASVYAVIGAITSEILLSKEGLGYVIAFSASVGNIDRVFGGIAFASVLGMAMYFLTELIERKGLLHGQN